MYMYYILHIHVKKKLGWARDSLPVPIPPLLCYSLLRGKSLVLRPAGSRKIPAQEGRVERCQDSSSGSALPLPANRSLILGELGAWGEAFLPCRAGDGQKFFFLLT